MIKKTRIFDNVPHILTLEIAVNRSARPYFSRVFIEGDLDWRGCGPSSTWKKL